MGWDWGWVMGFALVSWLFWEVEYDRPPLNPLSFFGENFFCFLFVSFLECMKFVYCQHKLSCYLITMSRKERYFSMMAQWPWNWTWNLFLWAMGAFHYCSMHYFEILWSVIIIIWKDPFIRELNDSHADHTFAMTIRSAYIMNRKVLSYSYDH